MCPYLADYIQLVSYKKDLGVFFRQENQLRSPSLFDYNIRLGKQSDLLECMKLIHISDAYITDCKIRWCGTGRFIKATII